MKQLFSYLYTLLKHTYYIDH